MSSAQPTTTAPSKRRPWLRYLLISAAVFVALVALIATVARTTSTSVVPSRPQPAATVAAAAAPTPASATVGAPVPFAWYSGTGAATIHSATWTAKNPMTYGPRPRYGAFLVLDVTIRATSGTVSANPLYWSAKDAAGRTYNVTMFGQDPTLEAGELPAGEQSRGFVTIDAPPGSLTVRLAGPTNDTLVRWAIPAA